MLLLFSSIDPVLIKCLEDRPTKDYLIFILSQTLFAHIYDKTCFFYIDLKL
ncbi:unnamed protein product [Commensalibacter communis]|nr:unnamed protein product [Commensalibacter communis]CAI3957601.1 unnamed protein product [Commensalibacter communis]